MKRVDDVESERMYRRSNGYWRSAGEGRCDQRNERFAEDGTHTILNMSTIRQPSTKSNSRHLQARATKEAVLHLREIGRWGRHVGLILKFFPKSSEARIGIWSTCIAVAIRLEARSCDYCDEALVVSRAPRFCTSWWGHRQLPRSTSPRLPPWYFRTCSSDSHGD